jgi:hypothetical protein
MGMGIGIERMFSEVSYIFWAIRYFSQKTDFLMSRFRFFKSGILRQAPDTISTLLMHLFEM